MRSRYLTPEEVQAVRRSMAGAEWLPLWVSLETGLRIGDVVSLRRASLREDGIHFRAKKTRKNGMAPISAALRKALAGRGKWLFPSPSKAGAHLTRQAAWARIKRAANRAGVDIAGVSPHSLRKCFAVELYRERGFRAAQEALQHRNGMTTELYAFADWQTGENAAIPLQRRDLQLVIRMVLEAIGEDYKPKKESRRKGER